MMRIVFEILFLALLSNIRPNGYIMLLGDFGPIVVWYTSTVLFIVLRHKHRCGTLHFCLEIEDGLYWGANLIDDSLLLSYSGINHYHEVKRCEL